MLRSLPLQLILLLCFHSGVQAGSYVFDYNDNCRKAYQQYLALHMPYGRSAIIAEVKDNPYNLMATYVADYEDCLVLLLNCDKSDYARRQDHFASRLELLAKGNEKSPWYRFCKAGIYMHWAIVNTRFGDQYKAALKFRKAFSLIRENQLLFPGFEYNNIFSGLEEAVVGSLPGNYRWLATIFGLKGDVKAGSAKLAALTNAQRSNQPFFAETLLYYLYIRFYLLHQQTEVWTFLNSPDFPTADNLLNTFVKANIALDFRKSDAAIAILKAAAQDADYNAYPIFHFQLGLAMLTRSDISSTAYFQKYLELTKSDLYIKESLQKMAWICYLNGDMKQAGFYRDQIKTRGSSRLDPDKQAQKFGESKAWPVKKLLQARLLIDGGYPEQAFKALQSLSETELADPATRAEYYFRLARVYEDLGDYKNALTYYQFAINTGKARHEQFAARAALQMGLIYERNSSRENALKSYRQCLAMPYHDFQNSIDQLAKAGINRLEGN